MFEAGVLPEALEQWRSLARHAYERLPEPTRALGLQVLAEGHLEEPVKLGDSGYVEARVHSAHRGSAGFIVHGTLRRELTCPLSHGLSNRPSRACTAAGASCGWRNGSRWRARSR